MQSADHEFERAQARIREVIGPDSAGGGKADGLGIGLAVSRMIIEARGGRLWASANEDAGETFQFTLPVARSVGDSTSHLDNGTAESDYASSDTARVDS